MKLNLKKIFIVSLMQLSLLAYPMVIQQYPISLSVKPNIILTFDDSGSMSRSYIPDTPSPSLTTESTMSYYYNPLFYNPNVVYKPWVKTKTSSGLTYYPQAPLSTINSITVNNNNVFQTGDTLLSGVTYTVTYDCSNNNWDNTNSYNSTSGTSKNGNTYSFNTQNDCKNASPLTFTMSKDYTVRQGQTWVPSSSTTTGTTYNAVYYLLATSASVTGSSLPVCGTGDTCATAPTCTATSSCAVPPTLPSGISYKLKKYTIASTDTVGLQNYANWKQYAYSRQNMVSHALSEVISGIVGVNIGFQPFNSTSTTNNNTQAVDSTVTAHTLSGSSYYSSSGRMYNMDNPADVTILLDLIYNTESNSATPTRTTLLKVGNQFKSATSTLVSTNDDGSSFTPTTKGIIQYSCQKNAAFIITDGYTNESPSLTMPSYDTGLSDQTYSGKQPYWNTSTSKSQFSTSLSDIALRFYTNNLRSDLSLGQVPIDKYTTGNADLNKNLHLNTYAITLGANGNIFGMTSFANQTNDPYTYAPTWIDPTQSTNNPNQIDDLWHSTINGRGAMFTSGDPATLAGQLQSVVSDIVTRAANRDSIAVASNYITSANNAYYVPSYTSSTAGDVTKFTINLTNATPTINTTPVWSAYTQLAIQIASTSSRNMVTLNSSGTGISVPTGSTLRTTQLGSLINSSPVVIQSGSSTIVYQAANDGLLHAFDALTGNELWAYAPSFLNGQVATGTNQYVLDGTPAYGYVNGKTYLIGGTGFNTSHNGYYAIDISTPATTSTSEATVASGIKWEFPVNPNISPTNQAIYQKNLGTGTSRPMIFNTKAFGTVVAISSGYNNGTGTIGGVVQTGGDGQGHVWLLDPATGSVKAELATSVTGASTAPVGMASLVGFILNPRSDTSTTALYGGDALGNLWKFNISESNLTNWTGTNSSKVSKIATLTDINGKAQPVTSSPMVSANATTNNAIIYVATGQLFSSTDISSSVINSFYSIEDTGTVATRSSLLQLTSTSTGVSFPTSITKTLALNYKNGWYFDFSGLGERALARVGVSSGIISFTTNAISTNACVSASYSYNFTIPPGLVLNSDGSAITPTWAITITPTASGSGTTTTSSTINGGTKQQISNNVSNPIIVFIKGVIYTLGADNTLTQVGSYTSGRQMGTWRVIIRK